MEDDGRVILGCLLSISGFICLDELKVPFLFQDPRIIPKLLLALVMVQFIEPSTVSAGISEFILQAL